MYSAHDPNINEMVSAVLILLVVHIHVDITLFIRYIGLNAMQAEMMPTQITKLYRTQIRTIEKLTLFKT